jgi:hypothetical protein
MSNDKNKNPLLDILARKKAQQQGVQNGFNPTQVKQLKGQKGSGKPSVMRKQGRGS